MRLVFIFLVVIHGLIHLMGFAKAYKLADVNQMSLDISKPVGMFWLFVSVLFIVTAILFLLRYEWWFAISLFSVLISQVLILLYWKDAKFGTLLNLIIFIVGISAFGKNQFSAMAERESKQILENIQVENLAMIFERDVEHLPVIIQKWMRNSGVLGKEKVVSLRLKQIGTLRTEPEGKWMPFSATQYFNVEHPAFVWTTEVDAMYSVNMIGRDKLINGEGAMLIKLGSIIPVVNESDNKKINSGAMVRFLAEICWFPSAALNDHIVWESIDAHSAIATLRIAQNSVSGIFKFNSNGDVISFEADRYYGGSENAQLEKWIIKMDAYQFFDGIRIPNKCNVTWKLNQGDFNWLNLEITDLEYNVTQTYSY